MSARRAELRRAGWGMLAIPAPPDPWSWLSEVRPHAPESPQQQWLPREVGYWRRPLLVAGARLAQRPLAGDPQAHLTEEIYICAGAQTRKTRGFLFGLLCWCAAVCPRRTGLAYTGIDALREQMNDLLLPTFERTPELASLLPATANERRLRITALRWKLPRMAIYAVNAQTAASLRRRPLELIAADEFDIYPENVVSTGDRGRQGRASGEGDPMELLLARGRNYPNTRLFAGVSTPRVPSGHCWRRLCSGSHERLLVACRGCGAHRPLCQEGSLRFPADATDDELLANPALTVWACVVCGRAHSNAEKDLMIAEASAAEGGMGRWVPGTWRVDDQRPAGIWQPSDEHVEWVALGSEARGRVARIRPWAGTRRSYHLHSLYSSAVALHEVAAKEVAGRNDELKHRAYVNLWQAAPLIPGSAGGIELRAAAELRAGAAPYLRGECAAATATMLLLTLDQQGNSMQTLWFPWVLRAWRSGPDGGESWLIDCGQVDGLAGVEELLARSWLVGNQRMGVQALGADNANGNLTYQLRLWAAGEPERRLLLRGESRLRDGVPWQRHVPTARAKAAMPEGVQVYEFQPDYWKDKLAEHLQVAAAAARWHLPTDVPDYYQRSLVSEERVLKRTKISGGQEEDRWHWQPRTVAIEEHNVVKNVVRRDNHWWDAEVMNLVLADVLRLLGPRIPVAAAPAVEVAPGAGDWMGGYTSGSWH